MNIHVDRFTGRIKTAETEGYDLVIDYQGNLSAFELENLYKYTIGDDGYQLTPFVHKSQWKNVEEKVNQQATIDTLGIMLVQEKLKVGETV